MLGLVVSVVAGKSRATALREAPPLPFLLPSLLDSWPEPLVRTQPGIGMNAQPCPAWHLAASDLKQMPYVRDRRSLKHLAQHLTCMR